MSKFEKNTHNPPDWDPAWAPKTETTLKKTTLTDSTQMSRFDLEQQILKCWHVVDDLELLEELILDRNPTTDELANIVLGLKSIYKLKFEKCFDTFEKVVFIK